MFESLISPDISSVNLTFGSQALEAFSFNQQMGAAVELVQDTLVSLSIETEPVHLTVTGVKDFETDEEELHAVSAEVQVEEKSVVGLTTPDTSLKVSYDIGPLEMQRITKYKHRTVIIYKNRTTSRIVRAFHPEPRNCKVVSFKHTISFLCTKMSTDGQGLH